MKVTRPPRQLTDAERAELVEAGWTLASDPCDLSRDDWRDPSSRNIYPAWRALEIARRDRGTA